MVQAGRDLIAPYLLLVVIVVSLSAACFRTLGVSWPKAIGAALILTAIGVSMFLTGGTL